MDNWSLQWDHHHHQLPELVGGQHPRSILSLRLRAILARVSAVSGGPADGTGVVSEDGAGDLPVVRPERVRAVDLPSLAVLLAEAAVICGAPAATGVREAADGARLCGALRLDDAPRRRGFLLRLLGVDLPPVAQPLQECAQVHVVVPHVKAVLAEDVRALDIHSCLHRGHFWNTNFDQFQVSLESFKFKYFQNKT